MQRRLTYKMFYKQFSTITDTLNPEFVENFDYWLATLPRNNQENITSSVVSSRLGVSYSLAEAMLQFAERQKILEKHYLIECPDCEYVLQSVAANDLADILADQVFCNVCEENKVISLDNVYIAYKVILQPDVTEEEIAKAIEKRLNLGDSAGINFSKADSLANKGNIELIYEIFYNPSESAYNKFKELRRKLDLDYKKNTTAKGDALETLVLEIFNQIKNVYCTNDVKTKTNQFDCTGICSIQTSFPSVFSYLSPYFIIECKNEIKKPGNTYCNKLLSIMNTNEAQVGIIVGRKKATGTCFEISREHYLKHYSNQRKKIIITLSDDDLKLLIDSRVNLLRYLEFKIFQVTSNSPAATFEMFSKQKCEEKIKIEA